MNSALVRALPALAALVVGSVAAPALAARPSGLPDDGTGRLADGRALSARGVDPRWGRVAPAHARHWQTWLHAFGPSWAAWDDATQVPRQILVHGAPAPGVVASGATAERFATELLDDHLELLAPGTTLADWTLVTNEVEGDTRVVAFTQRHAGVEVIGGQLSVQVSHDRLVAVRSRAWPDVAVAGRTVAVVADATARHEARSWIAADVSAAASAHTVGTPQILAVADGLGGIDYREVVAVDVTAPGSRWVVYLDAATANPVARRQTLLHASGTLLYDVPLRGPLAQRADLPAPYTDVTTDGAPTTTDGLGTVAFANAVTTVGTSVEGPFARVVNAAGDSAATFLNISDGGAGVWSAPDDELLDAQLAAWVHTHEVKEYIRAIDPTLSWLDSQIQVTVNRNDDECNANSDGDSINFFLANDSCENTARLSDVVYHEFGHSTHNQSIVVGVGSFDTSLSEGVSDYLSATITNDSGLARGFFYDDEPLRELDPVDFEHKWPDDIGEVHYTGLIIGGALWDLRELMIAKHGYELGVQLTDRIYYEATRRAVDIPSMYGEALLVDDDDGDLSNGTPNGCEINAAFGPHGLFSAGPEGEQLTIAGDELSLLVSLPSFPACPVEATARVSVKQRGEPDASAQTFDMDAVAGGFSAKLPAGAPDAVQNYRVELLYSNGAVRSFPDNLADTWYERYLGEVVELYCTSFETGETDWVLSDDAAAFEVGPPPANSSVDPTAPAGADPFVLGSQLDGDGAYEAFSNPVARSPAIAIPPGFGAVRLQYQRWLTVEDGYFDQAWIEANGQQVWANYATDAPMGIGAVIHHRDREWRFHDVDVTAQAAGGSLELSFGLRSDPGLQFGGWTIDELCVVGVAPAAPGCGNAIIEPGEDCDDGNLVDGDGCTAQCVAESPAGGDDGPRPGEDDEDPDDGDTDGDPGADDVASTGRLVDRGCACRSTPRRDLPWAWLLLAFGLRRRRSRRAATG